MHKCIHLIQLPLQTVPVQPMIYQSHTTYCSAVQPQSTIDYSVYHVLLSIEKKERKCTTSIATDNLSSQAPAAIISNQYSHHKQLISQYSQNHCTSKSSHDPTDHCPAALSVKLQQQIIKGEYADFAVPLDKTSFLMPQISPNTTQHAKNKPAAISSFSCRHGTFT